MAGTGTSTSVASGGVGTVSAGCRVVVGAVSAVGTSRGVVVRLGVGSGGGFSAGDITVLLLTVSSDFLGFTMTGIKKLTLASPSATLAGLLVNLPVSLSKVPETFSPNWYVSKARQEVEEKRQGTYSGLVVSTSSAGGSGGASGAGSASSSDTGVGGSGAGSRGVGVVASRVSRLLV